MTDRTRPRIPLLGDPSGDIPTEIVRQGDRLRELGLVPGGGLPPHRIQDHTDALQVGDKFGLAKKGDRLVFNGAIWVPDPSIRLIEVVLDGHGIVITTGVKADVRVQGFSGFVEAWSISGRPSGSIVVDVWKETHAAFPPTVADTIAGTELPTLASAAMNEDRDLTTWNTLINDGDWLSFNVNSATSIVLCTVVLQVRQQ